MVKAVKKSSQSLFLLPQQIALRHRCNLIPHCATAVRCRAATGFLAQPAIHLELAVQASNFYWN